VTDVGLKVTDAMLMHGTIVKFASTVVEPVVAMKVTVTALETDTGVTVKVLLIMFWEMATLVGAEGWKSPELLFCRPTLNPAGAGPLIVTVPVDVCPHVTVVGEKASIVTTGAFTVSGALAVGFVLNCGTAAVMVTFAFAPTAIVVILNVALVAPAAILGAGAV